MFRFLVICGCLLAVGQAGVIGGGLLAATAPGAVAVHPAAAALSLPGAASLAVPTIATSSSNVIRGIGNLAAISAYSKSVDTPFSSVRKADVRVNNPGVLTVTAVPAPVVAVGNTAVSGPVAAAVAAPTLLTHGLTTAIAAPAAAYTTGLAAAPLGLNGLALNGLGVNGLGVNGLGVNGLGLNGLGLNGLGLNGLGLNGLALNGLGAVKVL